MTTPPGMMGAKPLRSIAAPPSDSRTSTNATQSTPATPWCGCADPPPGVPVGGLGMHAQHDLVGRDQKGHNVPTATYSPDGTDDLSWSTAYPPDC